MKLVDRMEKGDVLVVNKLDRLGRNAMDVTFGIKCRGSLGIKCRAFNGIRFTLDSVVYQPRSIR